MYFRLLITLCGNNLYVLIAENSTDTASACSSFARENAGVKNLVFACRTDNKLTCGGGEPLLCFTGQLTCTLGNFVEGNIFILNFNPGESLCSARDYHSIPAGFFETSAEGTAAV